MTNDQLAVDFIKILAYGSCHFCSIYDYALVICNHSAPPPGISGDFHFPSSKSLPKALYCEGETDGKISAIRPRWDKQASYIWVRKQNHCIHQALRGQADSKIPALFPHCSRPSPRWWAGGGGGMITND